MYKYPALYKVVHHYVSTDQVAVPDYPSGATEHWGLMTYRESRLLYDPLQVGDPDKQNVAKVLAHEALHNVSHPGSKAADV